MNTYRVTEKIGARKRATVGYFMNQAVATEIAGTFEAESEAAVETVPVFEGETTAWLNSRDVEAREAILNKLSDSERKLLGL